MIEFFAKDHTGDAFILFGPAHLVMLGIILGINLALIFSRCALSQAHRRYLRVILAGILAINEVAYQVWLIVTDQWHYQWNLPLHLCTIFVWGSVWMLLSKSYPIFEIIYLLGIGAAIQPLLTSEVGAYGFPHYYAFQIFISHGGIITSAIFMAAIEGHRPTLSSIKKVFVWSNVYMLLVTFVNLAIGSNYLYTLHKPTIPTILDRLGSWPWYILAMEAIGLMIGLILYLPFLLQTRRP